MSTSDLDPCRRESTDAGPDFCAPCSSLLGDWVQWEGHQSLVSDVGWLREQNNRLRAERDLLDRLCAEAMTERDRLREGIRAHGYGIAADTPNERLERNRRLWSLLDGSDRQEDNDPRTADKEG